MATTATRLLALVLAILATTQNVASGKSHSPAKNGVWEKNCPDVVADQQDRPQLQDCVRVEANANAEPHRKTHDGQWVTVEAVTDLNEVATVYNLRVSDYHTYFVGSREWGFSVWAHNANYVLIPLPDGGYRLALVEANGMVRIVEGITHATLPGVAIAENVGILTRAQIERILAVPAATSGTAGGRAGGTLLREVAGTAGTAEEKAAALVAGRDLINARFGEGAYTLNQIQNPNGGWILFEGRPQTISSVTSPAPVVAIHPDGRMFKSTSESLTRGSRTTFDPYVAYRRPELRDPSIAARNYYCQEFIGGNWVDVPPLAR